MSADTDKVEADRQLIREAKEKGTGATVGAYLRLSGPGWLQSAITLGGGSLAGALYLGVIAGYGLIWVQWVAMAFGVVMLSAIGYVALSTQKSPFLSINEHVSPVLGWGWVIATMMANMVWCLPQFSLGTAAITQNLMGIEKPEFIHKLPVALILLAIGVTVIWFYNRGSKGVKMFEILLKVLVGIVVLSFFGVVVTMLFSKDGLPIGKILAGFVPNPSLLWNPAPELADKIKETGAFQEFWTGKVVAMQKDVIFTAVATAVGINMTFLLPYSMLRKGWGKDFRGLAVFDLSTGLIIPFVLATTCVVIASASQFHGKPGPRSGKQYVGSLNARLVAEHTKGKFEAMNEKEKQMFRDGLSEQDKTMASMLVKRDAFQLADSLKPLTGKTVSHYVFGIGVVGMAVSTIIILMLINGFVVCEIFGYPQDSKAHFIGSLLPAAVGVLGPFIWSKTAFWLAVPTSLFGLALLPIAYVSFLLLMNNKAVMGDEMPKGGSRIAWNVLMIAATGFATFCALWNINSRTGDFLGIQITHLGFGAIAALVGLAVVFHFVRPPRRAAAETAESESTED